MFKEILKIIPSLSNGDLNKMERSLGSRFGRIAKKFGKGLTSSLMGGGIAGLALGLIDKLLNPLKEVQESIDRTLKQGDDIMSNAEQFGTSAGKLFKLSKLAQAKGVDQDQLFMLLQKFQVAVAEAQADPNKATSVRQFVGQKDTADAFFGFVQGLQKLTKEQQLIVQQEIFGEKQIGKIAEFFNAAPDFGKLMKQIGLKSPATYDQAAKNLGGLDDMAEIFKAGREANDFVTKGSRITEDMIVAREAQIRAELQKENDRLGSYHALMKMERDVAAVMALVEKGYAELLKVVQRAGTISDLLNTFKGSRVFKGMLGSKDGN